MPPRDHAAQHRIATTPRTFRWRQLTISSKTLSEQELFDYGLKLHPPPPLHHPRPLHPGALRRQVPADHGGHRPGPRRGEGAFANDVVQAVLQSNVLVPAGSAQIGGTGTTCSSIPAPRPCKGSTTCVEGGGRRHRPARRRGRVRDGYAVQENVVRLNGEGPPTSPSSRRPNASTLAVVEAPVSRFPSFQAAAPEGMELKIDFDQSVFVRAAIENVLHEAALASVLVSLMILFFLGSLARAVLVMTSIPLAILVGLVGLFLSGQSLNLMTMGGLALAIGCWWMSHRRGGEHPSQNRHMGKPLTVAILDGAQQIAVPALAATLTICVVFFPVSSWRARPGSCSRPWRWAWSSRCSPRTCSRATLVPTLARILMEKEPSPPRRRDPRRALQPLRDRAFASFQEAVRPDASRGPPAPTLVLVCSGLVLAITAFLPFVVGLDFFPAVDAGQMRLHYRAPSERGWRTASAGWRAWSSVSTTSIPGDELETINSNIGCRSPSTTRSSRPNTGSQDADILIALKAKHAHREVHGERIRRELPDEFPGPPCTSSRRTSSPRCSTSASALPSTCRSMGLTWRPATRLPASCWARSGRSPGHRRAHSPGARVSGRCASTSTGRTLPRSDHRARRGEQSPGQPRLQLAGRALLLAQPQEQRELPVVCRLRSPRRFDPPRCSGCRSAAERADSSSTPTPGDTPNGGASYLGAVARLRPLRALDDQPRFGAAGGGRAGQRHRSRPGRCHARHPEGDPQPRQAAQGHPLTLARQSESMFAAFGRLASAWSWRSRWLYLLLVVLFQSFLDPFIILGGGPGRPGGHPSGCWRRPGRLP